MLHDDRRWAEKVHQHDRRGRYAWITLVAMAFTVLGSGLVLAPLATVAGATGSAPGLRGGGSIDEAWLTGARPGDRLTLLREGHLCLTQPIPEPPTPSVH